MREKVSATSLHFFGPLILIGREVGSFRLSLAGPFLGTDEKSKTSGAECSHYCRHGPNVLWPEIVYV